MKSLITKIIGACLGLSLATGVGVGITTGYKEVKEANAAEEVAYTLDGTTTGGSSGYATESAITQNSITWGVFGNTTMNPWRIGGKSLSNVNREIYSKEKVSSYDISKVTIDVGTASGVAVNSLTLKVGTAQKGSQTSTVTGTFGTNRTITFTKPSGADWSNKFFDIVFNISVSDTSNKFIEFKNAKFYKDSSEAALESLEITGNLTKTSFVFGEAWNHNGLSLVGHYSDNTTKAVTSGMSWSYNPGCTNAGVTSLTITAAVEGKTATYTTDVTITKVASPYVNGVPYKMYLNNGSANYYFIGSKVNDYYGGTTNDSTSTSIVNVYFEPKDDGQALYFYANNDTSGTKQYLFISVNGTHINFDFGSTVATWYYNGKTICTFVSSVDGIYGMGNYGTHTTFSASASYFTSDYFAQFSLVNPLTAEDFANQFLDIVTCDSTGETAPTYKYNYTWDALKDIFNLLDSSEQDTLKTVDITDSGVVAEAMARYNYIVAKYSYNNFVNRTISNVSNRIMNINNNSEVTIIVVSMIAIVMSSVLAFYFFKKKKYNR